MMNHIKDILENILKKEFIGYETYYYGPDRKKLLCLGAKYHMADLGTEQTKVVWLNPHAPKTNGGILWYCKEGNWYAEPFLETIMQDHAIALVTHK